MGSAPNCAGNGKGKMGIKETDGGVLKPTRSKKMEKRLFFSAGAV